jgi:hypothetical protein
MEKHLSRYVRQALAHDLAAIITHVGNAPMEVDFPKFVADLLTGTFQAIVDSSSQQVRAYAELIHAVRESIDDFADDHARTRRACDELARRFPELVEASTEPLPGRREAVRIVMGINRIVVTDGKINA